VWYCCLLIELNQGSTSDAVTTMKQAQQEINKINVEKKEYVDLWRASLVGMTRRDAALAQAEQAVHQQEEQGRSLQTGMRLARSAHSLIQIV